MEAHPRSVPGVGNGADMVIRIRNEELGIRNSTHPPGDAWSPDHSPGKSGDPSTRPSDGLPRDDRERDGLARDDGRGCRETVSHS